MGLIIVIRCEIGLVGRNQRQPFCISEINQRGLSAALLLDAVALQLDIEPAVEQRFQTLELVGLEGKGDRMPDELSGGEQQRVAIARAFVNRPMILIADEPTGNLDPTTSVGIMKLLDRINRTGTTVVMATHDAAIVDSMRRRVVELSQGRVVRDQRAAHAGQALVGRLRAA